MNQLAVVHQGRGIDCFALDAHTFRIRLRCAAGDFDRVELCYALNKYEWHMGQQRTPMQRWGSDGINDYYTYDLQGEETRIAYIFILYRGKRKWYFSEEGVSKDYDFTKGYYTFFQYPYVHDCDIHHTISWADRAVIYQIFPERFAIGIPGKEYITAAWDKKPTPKDYYGGDLPGIEQHLDYLTDLGVNCIYYDAIYILFHTGLRISEFCGLTFSDIEFKQMRIKVDHQLQRTSEMQYVILEPKTESGSRYIPMSEEVAACFRRIIANRTAPKVEPMVDGHAGFLFLDKNDRPMVALHWEKYLEHIVEKYNKIYRIPMPKVTPHVCRHTFCSNMAKSGMNPKTLQYIMGHSDVSVTLNVYTHVQFDDAQAELLRVAQA